MISSLTRGTTLESSDVWLWLIVIGIGALFVFGIIYFFRLRGIQTAKLTTPLAVAENLMKQEEKQEKEDRPEPDSYEAGANEIFDRYHESPEPHRVPGALRAFLSDPRCQDPTTNVTWYLFARIAQDQPFLLREYENLFRSLPLGRRVALRILEEAGDEQTKEFLTLCVKDDAFIELRDEIAQTIEHWSPRSILPLTRPVSTRADLDLLWCEFRATGNTEAVVRIVDTLERPDHVRGKLEDWLRATSSGGRPGFRILAKVFRRLVIFRLWKKAGILCDGERCEVLSPQDLDCHCIMSGWNIDQERAARFSKLLPVSLYGEDEYILRKAAARWSLSSHAHQYSKILKLCESEAARRTGRCRILLLEIVASVALSRKDMEVAFNALQEALTPDPQKEERECEKASAEWIRLERLSVNATSASSEPAATLAEIALRCARATQEADTYRSKKVWMRDAGREKLGVGDVVLECQFARPSNFRVFQTMWWDSGEVYDEWISTRDAHFRAPTYSDFSKRSNRALNLSLVATPYLELLRKRVPIRTGALHGDGTRYLFLEYRNAPVPGMPLPSWVKLAKTLGISLLRCHAILWIDGDTWRLARAVLDVEPSRFTGGGQFRITHSFGCYNEFVSIMPPAFSCVAPSRATWRTFFTRLARSSA